VFCSINHVTVRATEINELRNLTLQISLRLNDMHVCLMHAGTNHNKNKTLNPVSTYMAVHITCLYRQARFFRIWLHQKGYSHEIRAGYMTRTTLIKPYKFKFNNFTIMHISEKCRKLIAVCIVINNSNLRTVPVPVATRSKA
jgi:hypothetical protein